MELFIHISAPTTKRDDDRYRREALAYSTFQTARMHPLKDSDTDQSTDVSNLSRTISLNHEPSSIQPATPSSKPYLVAINSPPRAPLTPMERILEECRQSQELPTRSDSPSIIETQPHNFVPENIETQVILDTQLAAAALETQIHSLSTANSVVGSFSEATERPCNDENHSILVAKSDALNAQPNSQDDGKYTKLVAEPCRCHVKALTESRWALSAKVLCNLFASDVLQSSAFLSTLHTFVISSPRELNWNDAYNAMKAARLQHQQGAESGASAPREWTPRDVFVAMKTLNIKRLPIVHKKRSADPEPLTSPEFMVSKRRRAELSSEEETSSIPFDNVSPSKPSSSPFPNAETSSIQKTSGQECNVSSLLPDSYGLSKSSGYSPSNVPKERETLVFSSPCPTSLEAFANLDKNRDKENSPLNISPDRVQDENDVFIGNSFVLSPVNGLVHAHPQSANILSASERSGQLVDGLFAGLSESTSFYTPLASETLTHGHKASLSSAKIQRRGTLSMTNSRQNGRSNNGHSSPRAPPNSVITPPLRGSSPRKSLGEYPNNDIFAQEAGDMLASGPRVQQQSKLAAASTPSVDSRHTSVALHSHLELNTIDDRNDAALSIDPDGTVLTSAYCANSDDVLRRLKKLHLEVFTPSPPLGMSTPDNGITFVTPILRQFAKELPLLKRWQQGTVSRPIDHFEIGCWIIETKSWPLRTQLRFWKDLTEQISRRAIGMSTWCTRKPEADGALGSVRVFSWGEIVMHLYAFLLIVSDHRLGRQEALWMDARDSIVVRVPPKRRA